MGDGLADFVDSVASLPLAAIFVGIPVALLIYYRPWAKKPRQTRFW